MTTRILKPHHTGTIANRSISTGDTLVIDAGRYYEMDTSGATLVVDGRLVNRGKIDIQSAGYHQPRIDGHYYEGGGGGVLVNQGTLMNEGSIAVEGYFGYAPPAHSGLGGTFVNAGVLVNDGVLTAGGAGPGYFGAEPGVILDTGSIENHGSVIVGGGYSDYNGTRPGPPATLTVTACATLQNAATLAIEGVVLDEGRLTSSAEIVVGSSVSNAAYGSGGTLSVVGTLTNSGTIKVLGGFPPIGYGHLRGGPGVLDISGFARNEGAIVLAVGGYYERYVSSPAGTLILSGTLINTGTLSFAASSDYPKAARGILIDTGLLVDTGLIHFDDVYVATGYQARLNVAAGATLALSGSIQGTGTVLNDGTITAGDARTGTLAAATLVNEGVVLIGTGQALSVSSEVQDGAGGGTWLVGAYAHLSLTGSVSPGQTLAFTGLDATATLTSGSAAIPILSSPGAMIAIAGGGVATLAATDTGMTVSLLQSTRLYLEGAGNLLAIGSADPDMIAASGANATLSGGMGQDTLSGAPATHDVFLDTAAGLNGDTIADFAGADAIDVTDIAASSIELAYTQGDAAGTLIVSDTGTATTITLLGSFQASSFLTASDGHTGVLITL